MSLTSVVVGVLYEKSNHIQGGEFSNDANCFKAVVRGLAHNTICTIPNPILHNYLLCISQNMEVT